MPEFNRLSGRATWVNLSSVERDRTPRYAIEVEICCHLTGMLLQQANEYFELSGIKRSYVAIHSWVHKADLRLISTVSEDQPAVDEKMIGLHGQMFWLYSVVDPYTNEILHVSL